jgi:hypothetical protein
MSSPLTPTAHRIRLILATCLGLAGAVAFIILYWLFSGSLEDIETVFAGGVFLLILVGIAWLARKERVKLAAWLLVSLLVALITADIASYGIVTPAAAAYVIPILLAAFCLGLWAALGVAVFATAAAWVVAWMQVSAQPAADISQLTFNAPILTVILWVTAWMAGEWVHTESH